MKSILIAVFLAFTVLSAPSCSKKSGCPADSAQTKVDKDGNYKTSKTNSGLLPKNKNYKHKRYKPKHTKRPPI